MSSMSKSVAAQTAPASIAKPKNKLFGLSREQLKIVTGGGGVIIGDPILNPGGVIIGIPVQTIGSSEPVVASPLQPVAP